MSTRKDAFTLIELLVVIAIIAILAAILFPVFAQAKAAAKTTQAISNTKQIGTAQQIYLSDYDDTLPFRRFCLTGTTPRTVYSWKQASHPYAKNTELYRDPVNNSARYLDETSEPLILAAAGARLPSASGLPQFARGYALNNFGFFLNGRWDAYGECDGASAGFYVNTVNATAVDESSRVAAIFENKHAWSDTGSYIDWQLASGANPYRDADGVIRYSGWNWGGSKWDEKAMALVFMDSHSKRTAHSAICGMGASEMTPFGWRKANLTNMAPGGDMSWLNTYCDTMPAQVK
jgi:prepilin-type N-terminal cleavage/methylation domain-containing protein